MKRIIVTVKYDITNAFEGVEDIVCKQEVIEYVADTPEVLQDYDMVADKKGNLVHKVEFK